MRCDELVVDGKAPSDISALKPYWGKPAVRDFRGSGGNVGIIRSPVRATVLGGPYDRRGLGLIKPGTPNRSQGQGRSGEQTRHSWGGCEPALELQSDLGRLIDDRPRLQAGPEKFGRPEL